MRTTSNPAFRNLPRGWSGSYAGFDTPPGGGSVTGYATGASAPDRPMTIDDVVLKTATTLGVAAVAGGLTVAFAAYALALPAAIVGLVLALVIIFARKANAPLVLLYSAAEGVFLGGITGVINRLYPGIALQAIAGTFGVFAAMLIVYKTGAVRVTPRLTKWIIGATFGALIVMVVNLVAGLFVHGDPLHIRDGGPLAIVFSLVVIAIAAFNLLLDFDQADRLIRAGAPAKMAWYVAFGLTVTLVWLYLEILRLLTYAQRN